ncbi:MAG: intradiol ring-cleavage dioxygenase [Phototrophicaceae bacterium]|jgi:protocatechuate 3,4-dioxygenase beta subunit
MNPHHDELHDDDIPVGRVVSRRELLKLFGGSGVALIFGANMIRFGFDQQATPNATQAVSCVVKPEMTEGPYFIGGALNRRDIRLDPSNDAVSAGIPLRLVFNVSALAASACIPLENVQVDVWHCDADGVYSGVELGNAATAENLFLRGYQATDALGNAEFITIYPGWYPGRAVHIHFKLRTAEGYEFTSQFFFDDALSDEIYTAAPYQTARRSTLNRNDGIYSNGGDQMTLTLAPKTAAALAEAYTETDPELAERLLADGQDGYEALFAIALDLSDTATGASDGFSGGGRGNGGRPGRP